MILCSGIDIYDCRNLNGLPFVTNNRDRCMKALAIALLSGIIFHSILLSNKYNHCHVH